MTARRTHVALIGWGAIAQAVVGGLAKGTSQTRIVAVAVRDTARARDLPAGAVMLPDPSALADTDADLVVEAAGRDAVAPWGRAALTLGRDFAVSSTSAFADPTLLADLTALAERGNAQLFIPPGALGGIDALAAARRIGLAEVEHRIIKPPRAWMGTKAEALCALDTLTGACAFFSGTAAQAAAAFPQNANVALISALAGLGPDHTRITLIADPAATTNRHEIAAKGAFGTLSVTLSNAPLAGNPKTSVMTALSLIRMIENRSAPVVI
jgi:aspartate dehydrogenase